jgi:TRAP-type C4-dicarboxylate transport system substrate-binding protein
LQTGLINTIPTMPLYALAQQSFGMANQMLNLKWGVLMAGIVIDLKTWNRIPKKYHDDLLYSISTIQNKNKSVNETSERKSLTIMKKHGLKINEINQKQKNMWYDEVRKIQPLLRGPIIPEKIYDTVIELTRSK